MAGAGGRLAHRLRMLMRDGGPPPPTEKELSVIGRPLVRAAIRVSHRELVAAGMPKDQLIKRAAYTTRAGIEPRADEVQSTLRADAVGTLESSITEARATIIPQLGTPGYLARGVDLLAGGPGAEVLSAWAREGVDLIRTLSRDATTKLPGIVQQAAVTGQRWESIVEAVEKMGARTLSRARLIARDQVAKVNGKVTQELQTRAGIDRFKWRDVGDVRTRETHRDAASKDLVGLGVGIYTWAEGAPHTGFYDTWSWPGQAGQCRCWPEPVIRKALRAEWAKAA